MIDKLKERWDVKSNAQVFVILLVFAITGTTIVLIKRLVFELLGFDFSEVSVWWRTLYYLFILPIYFAMLILVGSIFGQSKFFISFVKKSFSRIGILFRSKS